jgi:glycosyltransferase involved in cell wall biosynthesis
MTSLVLVARKLDQGGAERQLVALAKGLKERGRDIQVVLFYSGGAYDVELAAAGVPVHFVGKRGRWDAIGFLVRLALVLRRLRPVAIYSFLDLPNILSALLRPAMGSPRLIWSIRAAGMEMRHYDWLNRLIPRLEAGLSRAANVIVANSHAGAAWAVSRGFPAARIAVVDNGIDTARFHPDAKGRTEVRGEWPVSADQRLIGLVARLDAMKDHGNFLQACALLAVHRDDLRFVCVGGGSSSYRAELEALAERMGIADRLIWAGARQDMLAVYCALDIACSSSAFGEGFSNAVGEAMACGVPCVVTDVGDSARIVGEVGEVAPPRDSDALAAAIGRMLDRLEGDANIGRQARDRVVAEYSLERMVLRTEQVVFGEL